MSNEPPLRSFTGIGPRTWEHPADRAALNALRKVPAFEFPVVGLAGSKRA